jgi:ATP-binding cassette subfamily C protein CydD
VHADEADGSGGAEDAINDVRRPISLAIRDDGGVRLAGHGPRAAVMPSQATPAEKVGPPDKAGSSSSSTRSAAAAAPPSDRRAARRWLARQGLPGRPFFFAAGAADVTAATGTVLLSWSASALIVAGVTGDRTSRGLAGGVLGVVAGGSLRAVAAFAADRLAATGSERVEAAVRDAALDALVRADPVNAPASTGAAVAAVCEQLPRLGDHYHDYQRRAIAACAVPAVMLAVIFPANWVVGILLTLATPVVPVNMAVTGLGAEAVSRRQLEQVAQLSGQVLERLQAMSTLRALGAIGHQRGVVERAAAELARRTVAVLRVAFLVSTTLEWVSAFAIGLVASYVGATLLGYVRVPSLPSHLDARAGVFVLLLTPAYFTPLRRFAAAYHQRQEAVAAAEILAPLTRPAPEARLGMAKRERRQAASAPHIVLRDAAVRFPGRTVPALGGVSLQVSPGVITAVTGPSGSGKSTLLKVAGGWLPPSQGSALIDGMPAADARGLLIGQRPYLFSGSLAENIALGKPGAYRDRIWAAADAAQLIGLILRLPDGLDTILGERGWNISGGEAQRVALARAFLSDAPFVLVDEPTAHLDTVTEAALIEPLARLLAGRTALIASHSDAVLGLADHVITLADGRVNG